jgi:hypothetical protein
MSRMAGARLRNRWLRRAPGGAAGVLAVALLLGACGPHVEPTTPATPPPPAVQLIAVLDSPFGTVGNTVRLVDGDGVTVASARIPSDGESITASGQDVLVGGGGRLTAIGRDGAVRSLGALLGDSTTETVAGLTASPDGRRWMWASITQAADGTALSRLYLAGDGIAARVLAERTEPGRALRPVAWTAGGPVVADEHLGIGGYFLFRREFGPTSVVDVTTAALRPLTGDDCAFSDLSSTGAIACVRDGREAPHGDGPPTLHLTTAQGRVTDVPFAGDTAQAGAAFFSRDSATVSVAVSPAHADGAEQIETDVVDVATGTRRSVGPAGLTPQGWLHDGRLLAVRIPGAAGGLPGTYVVSLDGTATRIATGSTVVGLLN